MMRGPARHQLIYGGGRSGKTLLFVRAIVARAAMAAESRHLIARFRSNAVRASIALDTLPRVMKLCFPGVKLTEHRQDGFFELKNGSQIWLGGLAEKDRAEKILGNEYATIFANECSQIPYSSILLLRTRLAQVAEAYTEDRGKFVLTQRAYYDLNPVGTKHWSNIEFLRKQSPVNGRPLAYPEDYVFERLNPKDNAENLSPAQLREYQNMPERQRRRFYDGEYGTEIDGALWPFEVIARSRLEGFEDANTKQIAELVRAGGDQRMPAMQRVVVAVDPSGTSGKEEKRGDDIGIVVVGIGVDGRGYVLADRTCNLSPEGWGRVVVKAYADFGADAVVAEKNFGGDMVRYVIKTADPNVNFKPVDASRGKAVRGEPVSGLYGQDKVSHVGRFPDLEDQMENFSVAGYMGNKSPDRADALIWGLTELMLAPTNDGIIGFYKQEAERQDNERAVVAPDSFVKGSSIDVADVRIAMLAPKGVSTTFGKLGHRYSTDSEGMVYVRVDDVIPLMTCGYVKREAAAAAAG